jgi:hypothetical protein
MLLVQVEEVRVLLVEDFELCPDHVVVWTEQPLHASLKVANAKGHGVHREQRNPEEGCAHNVDAYAEVCHLQRAPRRLKYGEH